MSEHTPLTEAERESLARALGCEFHDADYGECAACASHAEQVWDDAIESIVVARTSTTTADTGLRERVEALADEARDRKRAFPSHPHWAAWDFYERDLRDALDATAAPTTETGARNE